MPLVTKKFEAKGGDPPELAKIDRVVQKLTGASRRQVVGILERGCVKLNGAACNAPTVRLKPGDKVEVRYDPAQRYRPKPKPRAEREIGFGIVFEDAHLIVVEKPAELLSVPTHYREEDTLIQRVTNYLSRGKGPEKAFGVHRLDRGVSGLLVFAKSLPMAERLRDQFEQRKPEREYVALVAGMPDRIEGTFRSRLVTEKNLSRRSTKKEGEGELAITHYRVTRVLDGASLVSVQLETGRRNQIRVQFAEAGHPVLGDPRYRPEQARHKRWPHKRLALHAALLAFAHPVTGDELRFESALPMEFEEFLSAGKESRKKTHRRQ